MYGLSVDTDVSFFVGQTLTQACFGPSDLILNFQGDRIENTIPAGSATLSIGSSIGCFQADSCFERIEDFKLRPEFILNLLHGVAITEAGVIPEGTLALQFADGTRLEVYDDSDQYESYSICHGSWLVHV
jgi:hypothetical protein